MTKREEYKNVKAVVLQPSFIPWRGYFDQIRKADVFVFYDCVQYVSQNWRNRNRIKTPQGTQWLTIPVHANSAVRGATAIKDVAIAQDRPWQRKHLYSLHYNYRRASHFTKYISILEAFYARQDFLLADLTCDLTVAIARELGISKTRFIRSSTLELEGQKTDRLLLALRKIGADHYITGPSARDYLEEGKLASAGISVEYMNYAYPEYPQLHGPFEPAVTVLDLLFNMGPSAHRYIW